MSLKLDLFLENIGPHANTRMTTNPNSINMAIFAENGSGKSFISKSFKRISEVKALNNADPNAVELLKRKTSSMIRLGANKGSMLFALRDNGGATVESSVIFEPNKLPVLSENNPFIYHVFNSEYVHENLESVRYRPEDKINGYILGKVHIDLRNERAELDQLLQTGISIKNQISAKIAASQIELRNNGVQSNTTEFKTITFENIESGSVDDQLPSYEEVKKQYDFFLSMPEGIEDIRLLPELDVDYVNQVLSTAENHLQTEYSLSTFEDRFRDEMASKQDFIEKGLQLSSGGKCPFCGQSYNDSALHLIELYTAFLENEESALLRDIANNAKQLEKISDQIHDILHIYSICIPKYDEIREYFPSFSDQKLDCLSEENIFSFIDEIRTLLKEKQQSLKRTFDTTTIDRLRYAISTFLETTRKINKKVQMINAEKNKSTRERLRLRKMLCLSMFNELVKSESNNFLSLKETRAHYKQKSHEISEKEHQSKIDKRARVINEFQKNLDRFFRGKYSFDEQNFCITFLTHALGDTTTDVLSDGEKSILAFCYYLANIHSVVETEEDYNRLLFIIDDPVSSMDFNYVYNVAQAIRDLSKNPLLGSRTRYIVLTHNMEFMSILVRNKIVKQKLVLSHGDFEDFKDHYVMPYMSNLMDIYKVASKAVKPTHTIPNSLRHLLETIYRFEGFSGNIEDYILSHEELNSNGALYSLMQDCSHGGLRESKGYTDETLIAACSTVVDFIRQRYSGQISEIESILAV